MSLDLVKDIELAIQTRLPNFAIKYKNKVWHQKLIGFLVKPFNKGYMSHYTTTMFGKVYFPSEEFVKARSGRLWKTLAHEYVHLLDARDQGLKFSLRYLMPQLLAVLSLLAIFAFWNLWFLLALGFLGFAGPWRAKHRAKSEYRGYAISMAVNYWRHGSIDQSQKDWIAHTFYGPDYYYMDGPKQVVETKLIAIESAIRNGATASVTHPLVVLDIKKILKDRDLLKGKMSA